MCVESDTLIEWPALAGCSIKVAKLLKGGFLVARRGRTSIVREVKESIQVIDKIGQSKREARQNGTSGIHSVKQKENTMSDCQNFVKWCRSEHGVKSIADLNQSHYEAYMAYMDEKGLSKGHMRNVETSLRLLERGFQERSERFEGDLKVSSSFCPGKRLVQLKSAENVCNRSYSEKEMSEIRANCSKEVAAAIDLMQNVGLRVREAVNIRAEHFVRRADGSWKLYIEKGRGITKGGRYREVPVPENFKTRLESLLANKQPNERLVNVVSSTVRDGINVACKKAGIVQAERGAHGFRHFYARKRFDQLASKEQKQMMNRILENRSVGRQAHYGILSAMDKQLFVETKAIMDKVHGELGHGANRWELAIRYLKD